MKLSVCRGIRQRGKLVIYEVKKCLVFTKREYHRQGVAASIFQYLLADILKDNPGLREFTLNSSPYGKPFYLHVGFKPQSDEQEIDGIRFTPMKYTI